MYRGFARNLWSHDRREIHFRRVREVRCAEQRGNIPFHQGTNAVAQVPRQRSVTTRSNVPVSFSRAARKIFFDPKKLRPGQTGSFLKIPNLSPSLLHKNKKKKKTILCSSSTLNRLSKIRGFFLSGYPGYPQLPISRKIPVKSKKRRRKKNKLYQQQFRYGQTSLPLPTHDPSFSLPMFCMPFCSVNKKFYSYQAILCCPHYPYCVPPPSPVSCVSEEP